MLKNNIFNKGFSFFLVIITVIVISINVLVVEQIYSSIIIREKEKEFVYRLIALKKGLNSFRKDFRKNPKMLIKLIKNRKSFPYVRKNELIDPITNKNWKYIKNNYIKSFSTKKSFSGISYSSLAYLKYERKKRLWIFYKNKVIKDDKLK